jgi:hypothetical protein
MVYVKQNRSRRDSNPVDFESTSLRTRTHYRYTSEGDWSSGMIPALGAGGREFDSRITPPFLSVLPRSLVG